MAETPKANYLVQAWLVLVLAGGFGAALAGVHLALNDRIELNKRNETYDQIRAELYGHLFVTRPEGCRVFLDGEHVGETLLDIPLLRAGEYELVMAKSGFYDYT